VQTSTEPINAIFCNNFGRIRRWRITAMRSWWLVVLGGVLVLIVGAVLTLECAPTPTHPSAPDAARDGLAADLTRLQTGLRAKVGLVVRPVDAGPEAQIVMGTSTFDDQPAWSTIKVPLVMAAMRESGVASPTPPMIAAITESDNASAESIWESLGDPVTAAAAVEAVLREAGDSTVVESRKVRPEYSASGQTGWSLTSQAAFLSAAACNPRNRSVLDLMGEVTPEQRWGVGSFPGAKIKGGWGPSPSEQYLVRQIAILPVGQRGSAVIAMAAQPESGTFADGIRILTQIGDWLRTHLDHVAASRCHG
jgi:hypothetical protein